MTNKKQHAGAPIKALLGRKLGMTQVWNADGHLVPLTVVQVGTNVVTQVRTEEVDGYSAIQLGFGEIDSRKVTKPLQGHCEKAGVAPRRHLVEVRTSEHDSYELGQELDAATFEAGQAVDVSGTTKGKGFAGVMKRYGFAGGPGGHGAHFHRAPGSVGMCATPSRVLKGMRLPGHMGCDTVTVKNLTVMRVDEEQNLILVKGAIPGGKNGIVRVRMA